MGAWGSASPHTWGRMGEQHSRAARSWSWRRSGASGLRGSSRRVVHVTQPEKHNRLTLVTLVASAAVLFAAGMSSLSLPSLDDAFYARKGVEMARGGSVSFTVTWAGGTAGFQNPPLHFWLLAASFILFGEGDFAARLPSLLLACGTLLLTFRIGTHLTDRRTALTAVALLIASPIFVTSARGCMLDLPLTFWTSLALLLFIEGRTRPWLHAAIGLPLAAAILTKSVAGLLAVPIMAIVSVRPEWRPPRPGMLLLGVALGVGFGSSWMIHQGLTFGMEAVHAHAVEMENGWEGRPTSARSCSTTQCCYSPPTSPSSCPALSGWSRFFAVVRGRYRSSSGMGHPAGPPLQHVGGRSAPLPPPAPPAARPARGQWLRHTVPAVAQVLTTRIVPAVALTAAVIFVMAPAMLTRDMNAPFKRYGASTSSSSSPIPTSALATGRSQTRSCTTRSARSHPRRLPPLPSLPRRATRSGCSCATATGCRRSKSSPGRRESSPKAPGGCCWRSSRPR